MNSRAWMSFTLGPCYLPKAAGPASHDCQMGSGKFAQWSTMLDDWMLMASRRVTLKGSRFEINQRAVSRDPAARVTMKEAYQETAQARWVCRYTGDPVVVVQ